MEKPNFVDNGRFKLPIGYRFHPTDEELVVHYLKRKVLGLPLPASVIPEFDVFQNNPSSFPGDLREKRYFFCHKKLNGLGTKRKKTAGGSAPSGYWKPIGKGKQIVASDSNQAVGIRKTLAFKERNHSFKTTSQWFMHEYCLVGLATDPQTTQIDEVGDWVACSVFQRKRKPRNNVVSSNSSNVSKTRTVEIIGPRFIMDFTTEQSSDGVGPPSPCSSGVTEVSSDEVDREEISSAISLFSYPCNEKRT